MTISVMLFILISCSVLQSLIPGLPSLGLAKSPLLLSAVLYYSLTRERGVMLAAAFMAGLLQDCLSPVPPGYSSFWFCLIGLTVNQMKEVVFSESMLTAAFFGAVTAAVVSAGLNIMLWKDGLATGPIWWISLRMTGSAVLGAICTPLVFGTAFRLDRMVGNIPPLKEALDEEIGYI